MLPTDMDAPRNGNRLQSVRTACNFQQSTESVQVLLLLSFYASSWEDLLLSPGLLPFDLFMNRLSDEEYEHVEDLLMAGRSIRSVARETSHSKDTINRISKILRC